MGIVEFSRINGSSSGSSSSVVAIGESSAYNQSSFRSIQYGDGCLPEGFFSLDPSREPVMMWAALL